MSYAPLKGIVVLDLTQSLAGPFAGMLMGDLGADVIKIEMPVTGDGARKWGPPFAGDSGPTFVGFNRNKRSCAIDLHTAEGRAQIIEMSKQADVVLENFRPGTMKKFGIDYDTLKAHNPRLIYASISGYGQTGPLSGWAAMDLMIQAISGMMSVTGEPEGRPVKAAAPIADLMGGYTCAFSVLAAIHERSKSGPGGMGRRIDVSMLDAMITVLGQSVVATTISGEPPERQGNAHHLMAPYQSFRTATSDFVISLTIQKRWAALCTLPEFTHMFDDPEFQTQDQRNTHRARLCAEMEAIFMTRPVDYWMAHFERLALPAAPVNTIPQILENEHLAQRGTLLEVEYPPGSGNKYRVPGMPWRDVAAEQPLRSPPAVGQHTDEVLEQFGIGKGAAGRKTAAG